MLSYVGFWYLDFRLLIFVVNVKGTVMQIEKALINDSLMFQKYVENFAFQVIIIS